MPLIATLTMNPALDLSTTTNRVEHTHKLRCGPARYDPCGGGINVARVIRVLGGEVIAIFPGRGAHWRNSADAFGYPEREVPCNLALAESAIGMMTAERGQTRAKRLKRSIERLLNTRFRRSSASSTRDRWRDPRL
jgi:6-phosphofructokinase 2